MKIHISELISNQTNANYTDRFKPIQYDSVLFKSNTVEVKSVGIFGKKTNKQTKKKAMKTSIKVHLIAPRLPPSIAILLIFI